MLSPLRNHAKKMMLLGLLFGVSSLITVLVADRLLGLVLSRQINLIFPANTTVTHETSEFKYTASINSMGFRDRDVTPKVHGKTRILAIGDSYVYGWGVEGELAWPKILEAKLREDGQGVEVFNLGCPGYGPTEYRQVAHRAIPILSPDIIIVAILQGDDLIQEYSHIWLGEPAMTLTPSSVVRSVAKLLVPNLISLLKGQRHVAGTAFVPKSAFRGAYKEEVQRLIAGLTPQQQMYLDTIDPVVRRMWLEGDLNPYIMISALKDPDYFTFTLAPDRSEVKQAIKRMASCLEDIKNDAVKSGSDVVVVSVPFSVYVASTEYRRQFGFSVPDSALTGTAQDDVIECACKVAGVRFHSVTEVFRREALATELYYKYDGHFNAAGHCLFADEIAKLYLDRKL